MIAVVVAAVLTCGGALLVGQTVCWLCGARSFTFLAPAVGLAVLMAASLLAIHAPGRATTLAIVLLLVVLASIVALVRHPEQLPRVGDVLAVVPIFALALVPFIANGRAGTLGVNFDNDMAAHLMLADEVRSAAVAAVSGVDPAYPIGPHALVAVIAQGIGARVDFVFAGVTLATPVLLGWTALAALRRVGWLGRTFVATMVGIPYLIAGYYGQGSFKEVMQAMFVLAFALGLAEWLPGEARRRWRMVPLALLVVGSLSVYSVGGLPWLVAITVLWLAVLFVRNLRRPHPLRGAREAIRAAVQPIAIAALVGLVAIAPQIHRLIRFYQSNEGVGGGSGIPRNNLGNLAGPVSFWKVFGIWDSADYRLPEVNAFTVGALVALGVALAVLGFVWWVRRGDLAVPTAAVASLLIWIYSNHSQSPYVAAKALVILSPLVLLLCTRPLVELDARTTWTSDGGLLRLAAAGIFCWAVLGSSFQALRYSSVGPTNHTDDLRSIQPLLGDHRTLFLGTDDFIAWELAGTPVQEPFLAYDVLPIQPQKAYTTGAAEDFDEVAPDVLNQYTYVVIPRDPEGSEPPSNMHLIRTTKYYWVFKRVGPTPNRQILDEGQEPGAVLDCHTPQGRAIAAEHGIAATRQPNVEVPVPVLSPGRTYTATLPLHAGTWWLSMPYQSRDPIDVSAPGLRTTLPASLDRAGDRWLVGRITVPRSADVPVTMHVQNPTLGWPFPIYVNTVIASLDEPDRVIPLGQACGAYVDWYLVTPRPRA